MIVDLIKVNAWFGRLADRIIRLRWLNLTLFVLVLALGFYGSSLIKVNSSMESWFLKDDPLNVATNEFREIFGNDKFVGILIESEDLFQPESLKLIRDLSADLKDSVPWAERVTSLTNLEFTVGTEYGMEITQIVPDAIPNNPDEIETIRRKAFSKENFANKLVTNDSRQAFIMVKFLPFPENWTGSYSDSPLVLAGSKIMEIIRKEKYSCFNPKAAGIPVAEAEEQVFMGEEISRIFTGAVLIALILLILALRSVAGVIVPMLTSLSSIVIIMGIVGFTGYEIEPSIITMPGILGMAVALGYSIHIFNSFRSKMRESGKRRESIIHAVSETGWPLLFTALTTIAALLSFTLVPIEFIWFIGISSAGIVLLTYFTVLILTTSILSFGKDKKSIDKPIRKQGAFHERRLSSLSNWIMAHPVPIMVCFACMTIFLFAGWRYIDIAIDFETVFGRHIPYIDMVLDVAESELGSQYSYDMTIEFSEAGQAKSPEKLRSLEQLEQTVRDFKLTKRTSSILDIIKDMNQVLHSDSAKYYRLPETRQEVAQMLLLYENAGGTESEYWMDYDYKYYRMMVECSGFNSEIAQEEMDKIHQKAKELFPEAKVSVVGMIPQSLKMIEYLIQGQLKTFFIAMVVITVLMMIVFGSVKTGLIGLIPNIAPAVTVGGIMGWAGFPLDMLTITLIPMILGLAVDDTIHFMNHGKLSFIRTGNYRESVRRTFRTVGVALLMTSLILSANFMVYTSSEVLMLMHMGILATAGILSALIADFFVTPILFRKFRIFGKETMKDTGEKYIYTPVSDGKNSLYGLFK